ncbi:hypothetical protein [Mycolicibacterium vaccae]|uniref:hypothetical protein n=1 Tax=Mycolicibacterium vaccae TaxID=1810 RepID=UPI003D025CEE
MELRLSSAASSTAMSMSSAMTALRAERRSRVWVASDEERVRLAEVPGSRAGRSAFALGDDSDALDDELLDEDELLSSAAATPT